MKWIYLFLLFLLMNNWNMQLHSQQWKSKKCAVVLTYDDAIDEHLDNAAPVLDSLNLKATFYITTYSKSIQTRLNEWRNLDKRGHELGNHTIYHPCDGGIGREWVKPDQDLRKYSVQRMIDETRMANLFLEALDGKTKRTFAFTCGDMKIGDTPFINLMKKDFVAARAVRSQMHHLKDVDLYNIDCYMVNNNSLTEMKAWVDQAIKTNSLLVLLFHGVGGGNSLNVSKDAHRELLQYIKKREKDIWVAPMISVANYIQTQQSKATKKE